MPVGDMPIPDGDGEETDGLFDSCVLWLDSRWFTESYWWDVSPYRNNGIVHGAKWKENSFYFDGINDYVDCGNHESLNITDDISIEVVLKFNNNNGRVIWQALTSGGHVSYDLYLYNKKFCIRRHQSDNNFPVAESEIKNTNIFYHVVGVIGDNYIKIYVDGKEEETNNYDGTCYSGTHQNVQIGRYLFGSSHGDYLRGHIKLVRIYHKALNSEAVKNLATMSGF